ncbi:2-octaprenyl-6-methoxyphenol hydroxylase/2-octaprenylphenol hydroxylase [Mariprofundus ferrinatatus]|uniref:2-octaprenyl-6-methoxyphenol hydroxylase/2-octaprenylphenol hydroxylase n=1 Tax=Mariprofundus ferrinatatus TaxID=1921087 RepID=A0A2K8L4I8_9PROT|nr:FAD-dependent oxidoreductase [Mariprofundus ferrinatatus]ATX82197.1 2-octaprenyl-6-methoxyphenol hydroxylase/2-octaprenylphenol hydroxylase [Mariprofundus ferrinatatus]
MGEAQHFDIVIVGGGAVGATLALELERLAYRVAVIEHADPSFASTDPERVIALNYGSRLHLERLGLWQGVEAQGVGNIRHIIVTEPGNRGRVDLDASDGRNEFPGMNELGYVVEMGVLLRPLYEKLRRSSVTLFSPASLRKFETFSDRVEIEVASGDEKQRITASLMVAADGTHSQIRRMAGIGLFGWDYNRFGLVASVSCEKGHRDTAHECFRGSGPLAFLPLADGRFSIVWAATPAEATQLLAMNDDLFITALQKAAGERTMDEIGAITGVSKRATYPLELSIAKQFTAQRIALVGNAAHTIHPVAGQGMNLGFRDVADMVTMLEGELAHKDPGQPIILQGYAEKRRADVAAVATFTESMSHTFGSEIPGAKFLRGLALEKMAFAPTLQGLLLRQASGVGQIKQGVS